MALQRHGQALLVWCCLVYGHMSTVAQITTVTTAHEFSLALLYPDPAVNSILVTRNIDMLPVMDMWMQLDRDVVLLQNLTVQGASGTYPWINWRGWRVEGVAALKGVKLAPGVTIIFRNLGFKEANNVVPPIIMGGASDSLAYLESCVLHRYAGAAPNVSLGLFMDVVAHPSWEPPNYRSGVALQSGFCVLQPGPAMCWDYAYLMFRWMADWSNPLLTVSQSTTYKVQLVDYITVMEAALDPECFKQYYQGNHTCSEQLLATIQKQARHDTGWLQPTPSPERIASIMSAYRADLALHGSSSINQPSAAVAPADGSTSSSSKGTLSRAGIIGIAVAVPLLVASLGLAVWYSQCRGRANGMSLKQAAAPDPTAAVLQLSLGPASRAAGTPAVCCRPGDSAVLMAGKDSSGADGEEAQPSGSTLPAQDTPDVSSAPSSLDISSGSLFKQGLSGVHTGSFVRSLACAPNTPKLAHQHDLALAHLVTPDTPVAQTLLTNLKLGTDVILGAKIGDGAMGSVYRGTYQGQPVAVKLLLAGTNVKAFTDELAILGRTQHHNVVHLIGACTGADELALVEELADGSVEGMLYGAACTRPAAQPGSEAQPSAPSSAFTGPVLLPLPLVLHIAMEVATGLAYLHPTIIHRDLKPGNILYKLPAGSQSGETGRQTGWGVWQLHRPDEFQVKLSDFGLSRISNSMTLMTQKPHQGTVPYMAPECFVHKGPLTHKCDIYSFGMVLWELLHGVRVWQGWNLPELVYVVVVGRKRPAITVEQHRCPASLLQLMKRCWNADPDLRPPALELARELGMIQRQLGCRS